MRTLRVLVGMSFVVSLYHADARAADMRHAGPDLQQWDTRCRRSGWKLVQLFRYVKWNKHDIPIRPIFNDLCFFNRLGHHLE